MNDFTASNGITIEFSVDPDGRRYLLGRLTITAGGLSGTQTHATGSEEGIDALREFFRAEEDERLGRWRWPENPDYVVYPSADRSKVRVLRETGIALLEWVEHGDDRSHEFCHAARAYFDAHPEPRDPWEDAKAGEVWVMTVGVGPEFVAYVNTDAGFPRFIDLADDMSYGPKSGFTAGRRIYPEADAS